MIKLRKGLKAEIKEVLKSNTAEFTSGLDAVSCCFFADMFGVATNVIDEIFEEGRKKMEEDLSRFITLTV